MEGYSGKRAGGGFGITGRGSELSFKDVFNHDDRSVQCNRLVCSNRLNLMKGPQVGISDKEKSSSSLRTNGKAIVGSSSKEYSVTNSRKASLESHDPSSHKGTLSIETNNMQLEKVISEPSSSNARVQLKLLAAKDTGSGVRDDSVNTFEEVENYSVTSSTRMQKQVYRYQADQEASLSSSTRHIVGPRITGQATKTASHGRGFNASRSSSMPHTNRYGLRNLGCTSISDVFPPGCSSSDSSQNGRVEMVKRRCPDGEYSSAKGKSVTASSSAGNLGSRKNSLAGRSLSVAEHPSQPTSRRTRYWIPSRSGVASVRTRREINEDSRSRIFEHSNEISTSQSEPHVVIPQLIQSDVKVGECSPTLSHIVPGLPATGQNSSAQLGSRNDNVCNSPIALRQDGSARQFNGLSIDRDGYRHYHRDGIAEVLLALERIEHDEELTYEQLLVLETNLFLSGLGFRDQHRDMRLDIDNMSYEELLALGEKMGTVSTGLTEEQLSNCLKLSFYMPALPNPRLGSGGDDVKCSICQEEYADRDEMGTLWCDHHYHLVCIHQWLRLKNWCPICKAHAADS